MNTVTIRGMRDGKAGVVFRGVRLSDCIIKVGGGLVKWEKYVLYHTLKGNFILIKGTKPCRSVKYEHEAIKCASFNELVAAVRQQHVSVQPMLARLVQMAFDIYHAGTPSKDIKDRKHRVVKQLKQMDLSTVMQNIDDSKTPTEICYK